MHFNVLSYLILILALTQVFCDIKLVNVLLRHGDRTPGSFIKSCPNDPHYNETFYPMGIGGLTIKGKQRVYKLGKFLRSLYNDFLGAVYLPNEVEAVSSDSSRAQMSLQMTLAGLYPPASIQQWDNTVYWQPVLMSYKPKAIDTIFVPQMCEQYQKEYDRVKNTVEFQRQLRKLTPFTIELAKNMGRNSPVDILDMNHLYHTFVAEKSMNLSLPDWAHSMFPDGDLLKGTLLQYKLYGYSEKLRRLSGGVILQKMIKDMKNAQNKANTNSNYKIHVYSGHELNIVMLLQALGLYDYRIPEYSSSVIVELHDVHRKFYVKVLYYDGVPGQVTVFKISGCDEMCPFDIFVKTLRSVIPTEKELACKRMKKSQE